MSDLFRRAYRAEGLKFPGNPAHLFFVSSVCHNVDWDSTGCKLSNLPLFSNLGAVCVFLLG
jgi:hypothetical protein